MKNYIHIISFICCAFLTYSLKDEGYLYYVDQIFAYFDTLEYGEQEYKEILDSLSKIFENSYAFNDIAKNPPQPFKNYHSIVDIQEELNEINIKDIKNAYDFFRKISKVLSELKDPHIRLFFNDYLFNYFFIVGPFNYIIREIDNRPRIIVQCVSFANSFPVKGDTSLLDFCYNYNNYPVKSINGLDPFDYINLFGGNFVASKNVHGTFSFKLNFNNWVSLNDYPLSQEELNNLEIVFDDIKKTTIKTKYLIQSQYYIEFEDNNLRLLSNEKEFNKQLHFNNKKKINIFNLNNKEEIPNIKSSNNLNKNNINNSKNKNLRKLSDIFWNYDNEDIFKCYADVENKINFYYVASFEPSDRQEFIKTMINCVELFDKNKNPIVVINDMNTGGYASLAQMFMGVLSPLMPINLFKGRLRVTQSLKKTNELMNYINSNLTNIHDCQKANLDELLNKRVELNYSEIDLTDAFYINNITIHNKIEEIRKKMKNKRKPTEILVLTDGYSFSTAGLYIKYLQKMGGAMVAGFKGNPYNYTVFDSGQSPSMIFTSGLLNIFNKEEIQILNKYKIVLEIPGIQTFFDLNDKNVPLEYEVTRVDKRFDIYEEFDADNYYLFVEECLSLFEESSRKCYSKNVVKFTEKCDSNFKKHTHGGYACNNDGNWSNKCIEAYCDPGYSFDKNAKKCIKDICSSIPVPDDEEEDKSSFINTGIITVALLLFLL